MQKLLLKSNTFRVVYTLYQVHQVHFLEHPTSAQSSLSMSAFKRKVVLNGNHTDAVKDEEVVQCIYKGL